MTKSKPVFYMNIGLPASGKSTYCSRLCHAECVSGDRMRRKLFGDEAVQYTDAFLREHHIAPEGMNHEEKHDAAAEVIWEMVCEQAFGILKQGTDVIFDGTNLVREGRKKVIRRFSPYAVIHGLLFDVDVESCIERDLMRSRHVGEEVLRLLNSRFESPTMDEGFDELTVIDKDGNVTAHYSKDMDKE